MLALLLSSNYPGPDAAIWHYFGAALAHLVPALCFASFLVGDPQRVWSVIGVWRGIRHSKRRVP